MDKRYKELWTAALRSGEYQQSKGVLARLPEDSGETPTGYCCLGVLCDVFARSDDRMRYRQTGGGWWRSRVYIFEGESANTELPEAFLQHMGLTEYDQDTLIGLNDEENKTFASIADWIDENL